MATTEQVFTSDQFTATQWITAEEKAQWANTMAAWIKKGFSEQGFTRRLYDGLYNHMYGHIAHSDKGNFYYEWFRDNHRRLAWLKYATEGGLIPGGAGDPIYTWSDVERAFSRWITQSNLVATYEDLCRREIEEAEQARLAQLQAKYADLQPAPLQLLLPQVGPLAQVLHNAAIDIRLPSDALARLEGNGTTYSFTWLDCFHNQDKHWPDITGLSFEELLVRVFEVLFDRIHRQEEQKAPEAGQ